MLTPTQRIPFAVIALMTAPAFADDSSRLPVLKSASKHPVQYYLSLPSGWKPDQRWPVLLAVDASYGDFYAHAERFAKARKDLPFIVVVPFLTNGREVPAPQRIEKFHYSADLWRKIDRDGPLNFDLAAIDNILADLREQYGAEAKPFLTGWGQGAAPFVYKLAFSYPERWRATALACPFFEGAEGIKVSTRPERAALPLTVFHGESDFLRTNASLDAHWEKAKQFAEANGFKITRVLVPEKFHEPLADEVVAHFKSLIKP